MKITSSFLGLLLVHSVCGHYGVNSEVFPVISRVSKEGRAAGVLDNHAEGEKYAEHSLRKFVRNKSPEIMPAINSFFTSPEAE